MDLTAFFFYIFAFLAVAGALMILVTPHIVYAAVGLITSLSAVAILFFLAGAEFLGAMQIMIYVGGTVVLLAFGVMLTARLAFLRMKTTADQWVIALLVAAPLVVMLLQGIWGYSRWLAHGESAAMSAASARDSVTTTDLGMALVAAKPQELMTPQERAFQTVVGYILPFELVSLHLLVVLIGAAYIARRTSDESENTSG